MVRVANEVAEKGKWCWWGMAKAWGRRGKKREKELRGVINRALLT